MEHAGTEQFVEQAYHPVRAESGNDGEYGDGRWVVGMKGLGRQPDHKLGHGLEMIGPDGGGQKVQGQGFLVSCQIREIVQQKASPNQGGKLDDRAQHPDDDRGEATAEKGGETPIGRHRRSGVRIRLAALSDVRPQGCVPEVGEERESYHGRLQSKKIAPK